jgi:transcriptional regulator with XRE-family HTH domain
MLTKVREDAGLTKMELSRRANVHPSRVSAIELGRAVPSGHGAEMIRLALAISWPEDPSALLDPVDEPTPAEAARA